jgi:thioredoxin-related protein
MVEFMKVRLIALIIVIIIGISIGYMFGAVERGFAKKGGIKWLSYDEGMDRAKKEGKFILINFVTQWCEWCKRMDEDTFSNNDVKNLLKIGFIPIKVDAEKQGEVSYKGRKMGYKELSALYNVKEVPTTWFLESDGTLIAMMPGKIEPDYFIKTLGYVKDRAYKTNVTLADYAGVKGP